MCDSSTRPAFIPVPNTAKVTMLYQLNGQEVMNIFHFEGEAPWTKELLADLANVVSGSWITNIQPGAPTTLKLRTITALDLGEPESFLGIENVDEFGLVNNPTLPGNVTLSIKFDGGLSGRSNRGRMYWLQLTEADVAGDTVNVSSLGDILTAITGFFEDIDGVVNDCHHVVVSYCHDGEWRTTGQTTQITTYSSDGIVDSQRRRLTGRGR